MPRLTVIHTKGQGGTGQGERSGWDCKWMEGGEGEPAEGSRKLQSSNQTQADGQPHHTSWPQALWTPRPWTDWYSFAPFGIMWLVCQVEVLLHPNVSLVDVCWRFLLVCLLWMVLGGCAHALKYCLRPGQNQGEPPQRIQQEVVTENRNIQYSWVSRESRNPGPHVPLALALANSLLLCVLQEPLPDPSVPHIQALLSRLQAVSHTLEKADTGSEVTLDEVDRDSTLTDKVKLICTYLQKRMRSLNTLVQVQRDFEASVKDMLEGLEGLWAQLEELHTGVTLTKEGSRDHGDLASARTDAENLFAVLGHYRNRLQCCQTHLKDSTQLLQELTWSHTHISNSMSSSSESVWPELLLQSNIEQFDKVQENFFSVEQQTSAFQAHLEGLRKGNQVGQAGPLARANGASSCSASPRTSPRLHNGRTTDVSLEHRNSTSVPTSASSMDADTKTDTPLSLCERSALQFSATIGRLRKSGRRK
ncbi:uncharacterized protein si:ch211-151h10.2 isoform X2 [Lates calcarifer]|uniref:Uncharacterized protein si:ch211-151h10.2 isoform X2 n=1 Tax=Lates calcarifer TaxID=8187 RepID=A0AAJ7PEN7_LATCA|nr:uncharacterized protein si:ch211-151h10.2 isoform X2 [Lates calcarifer]